MKITIEIEGPVLPGSISTAKSRCGKTGCACKSKQPKLHGPYYRWTGVIDGIRTTKTISKEVARDCKSRIDRYKQLRSQIDSVIESALADAPWVSGPKRRRR